MPLGLLWLEIIERAITKVDSTVKRCSHLKIIIGDVK